MVHSRRDFGGGGVVVVVVDVDLDVDVDTDVDVLGCEELVSVSARRALSKTLEFYDGSTSESEMDR